MVVKNFGTTKVCTMDKLTGTAHLVGKDDGNTSELGFLWFSVRPCPGSTTSVKAGELGDKQKMARWTRVCWALSLPKRSPQMHHELARPKTRFHSMTYWWRCSQGESMGCCCSCPHFCQEQLRLCKGPHLASQCSQSAWWGGQSKDIKSALNYFHQTSFLVILN